MVDANGNREPQTADDKEALTNATVTASAHSNVQRIIAG